MKFIARWTFRLLLLALVVVIALVLLKDLVARELIETAISQAVGLECNVSRIELRLLSPTVVARDLRIYHPASLGGGRLVDVSELFLEYELSAMIRGDVRFRLMRLHVSELTLVEHKSGNSSLDLFKKVWSDVLRRDGGHWLRFGGVDTLNLNVERVRWLQLDKSKPPEHYELRLHDQMFQNLRTGADFQAAFERALTPVIMSFATNRPAELRPPMPILGQPGPRRSR